jgi:uncharacterized protein YdaL
MGTTSSLARSFVVAAAATLTATSCVTEAPSTGRSEEGVPPPSHEARAIARVSNTLPYDARVGVPLLGRAAPVAPAAMASQPRRETVVAAPGTASTLILFDTTGPWGWLGELYAMGAGNLASHFGTWTAAPVGQYAAGDLLRYSAAVYVGSTFDEPLPTAFLDDVLSAQRPVVWVDDNIWQLAARAPDFATRYGYMPFVYDATTVTGVTYKGTSLSRYTGNGAGLMTYSTVGAGAQVVATAVRADGATFPWSVRSNGLTYIGENPMSYVTSNDRYLAFADILFDALAPLTAERHRALLRIEDVDATASPRQLRAIADYLASKSVPFSIAVIPTYTDPNGVYNAGTPITRRMRDVPRVASAINYMIGKGGTIVLHGYTHQYSNVDNPYTGVSADDVEFYRSHVDPISNFVLYDGPVTEDSTTWAADRVTAGLAELAAAGLPAPQIFEYPHYAGSDVDSRAIRQTFSTVYHRGLYFGGTLLGGPTSTEHTIGVMYPYTAQDLYGFAVVPENLGSYEPDAANNNPPRLVADLVATAHANRVVRDGVASVFFHPYYGLPVLQQIVDGLIAEGYTFVSAAAVQAN